MQIQVFDLGHLGDKGTMWRTTACRRSEDGQKGRLSCLQASPGAAVDAGSSLLAAGSTDGSIFVYDARADGEALLGLQPALRRGGGSAHHATGITCLRWHPGGMHLFSGARQDNTIRCWDLRHTTKPVQTYGRAGATQQRLGFDVDAAGVCLVTGNAADGSVSLFDISSGAEERAPGSAAALAGSNTPDIVSHVALHPCGVVLSTCSGQRRKALNLYSDSDSDDDAAGSGNKTSKPAVPAPSQLSLLGTAPATSAATGEAQGTT